MDKNISKEQIEIGGKKYTLFINRTGLVTWEKHTKLQEKGEKYQKTYSNLPNNEDVEITDDTNPFEMYGDIDIDADENAVREIYSEFYWVALYTYHKLSITQARELFEQAEKEYGLEQLVKLALQMINDMNTNRMEGSLKNLKALRPEKQ